MENLKNVTKKQISFYCDFIKLNWQEIYETEESFYVECVSNKHCHIEHFTSWDKDTNTYRLSKKDLNTPITGNYFK